MYCQYCGAQIPNEAKFCLECGGSTGTQSYKDNYVRGSLRVFRDPALCATAVQSKIFVDGELKVTLADGGSSSFLLSPGVHEIRIKTPMNSEITQRVTVRPDTETVIHFKLGMSGHKITGTHEAPMLSPEQTRSGIPAAGSPSGGGRACPRCGGQMVIQNVSESRKSGCGTFILYLLLALTVLGLLIVIPLLLRKKTETVTYAVCQNCGYQKIISRR